MAAGKTLTDVRSGSRLLRLVVISLDGQPGVAPEPRADLASRSPASFLPGAAHTQQCSVSPHPLQLREGLPFHFLPFSDVGFSIMVLCSFPSLVTQCFCMYLAIDGSPFTTAVFLFLFFKELLCLF